MPDLAAFDFDGTLTDGGSVFGFLSALCGRGTVMAAAVTLGPQLVHAAVAGGTVADRTKELLFERVLAGVAFDRAEEVAASFVRHHLDTHLRSEVRRRFEWHRHRGDQVVIVSASPEIYIRGVGEQLGAAGVVATRLAVVGGMLTGRYQGANCRGDEKVRRLGQWVEDSGETPVSVWAYGNSRGDLNLLRTADFGVNVGRLGPVGRLRSFPGLSRTGPGLGQG